MGLFQYWLGHGLGQKSRFTWADTGADLTGLRGYYPDFNPKKNEYFAHFEFSPKL